MSFLTDTLKSGANMLAGSVSEKLGVDPTMTQGLIEKVIPGDATTTAEAEPEISNQEAQPALVDKQAEAAPEMYAEPQGLIGKAAALVGGSAGIAATATQFLDQDGDGNPLNDITNIASRFLGKQQNA